MNSLRFTRGAITPTRKNALTKSLSLENTVPGGTEGKFPGLHFHIGETGTPIIAQASALRAFLSKREIPVVIDFTLTPDNLHVLTDRLWLVHEGIALPALNPLTRTLLVMGEALINFKGIPHEDILKLEAKVGFFNGGERFQFQYKTYDEWSRELNARAMTREEMIQDHGSQRRK